MRWGEFRAAAVVAVAMGVAAGLVAWEHHLPIRDPDGANLPTWFRLPVIVGAAVVLDLLARWLLLLVRRSPANLAAFRAMVAERWDRDQIRFTLGGLVTWYVAYVAFRNLKSYVPFVSDRGDPTPGVANAPSWTNPLDTAPGDDPSENPSASDPNDVPSSVPSVSSAPTEAPTTTTTDTGAQWTRPLLVSAGGLALLVVLSLPATVRLRRRASRLDGSGSPTDQVEDAWAEVRDSMVDLGGRWPEGSPRAIGTAVAERLDTEPAQEMGRLATLVERSRYSRGLEPDDVPPDLSKVATDIRHGLAADRPRLRKVLAFVAPRSLLASLRARLRR